ncbi:MAG: bifunctional demethylmenaquinone methyltransferase/2-methoxy-6-polyprenyl-1,4-benzoquinol methylase [Gammaproteobacteria bacterium]|nr:bifunctional demethylmenaquinone methyltransferase/2-methoxy-6-polyprenyl-1,4-benzoquinol methylase [Gammaproteobacteria bacterium]|tara:strand:+ start:1376 stop:2128 length:753 start_codon:yes stop_codon:yes gene_type:complete
MKEKNEFTHFGFQNVEVKEKAAKVSAVFDSVTNGYDLMNDLMSLGTHRLLKEIAINHTKLRPGQAVLDLAGGTGDMALLLTDIVGTEGLVCMCDINKRMLRKGRERLEDRGILSNTEYIQGDGEILPFKDNFFDAVTISFGIRNFTEKDTALASVIKTLKPNGRLVVLEFAKPSNPLIKKIYRSFSSLWPIIGKNLMGDESSYEYLRESIEMHPDQETFLEMLVSTGFEQASYVNLLGGIVAIHTGNKPG